MTEELQADGEQEAVTVELPAPAGWKKFVSKKAGNPKRGEVAFISPTGVEIRNKRHLDRYLRSLRGGLSSSDFDWGYGDTPRRSARLSEKAKEMQAPEEEPSKKQGTHSRSKKGTKKKKEGRDSDAEDYSPEAKRPKKREKRSTPQKGTKLKTKSVDAGIGNEDAEMKDAEDVSVEGKGTLSAEAILKDSSAKVDLKEECKHKNDGVIAEVGHKAPVNVKIATEEPESVNKLDVKDSESESKKGIEEAAAKLNSNGGDELKKNDVDADIEDETWESEEIVTQAPKGVVKLDSNDDLDAETKDEAPIIENIPTQALQSEEDSDNKNVAKVSSNDDLAAEMCDEVPEIEQVATQAIECAEDSDTKFFAKVDSNDDVDAEAKNEGLESENIATKVIQSTEDSGTKIDAEVKSELQESEKMAAEALEEPFQEDLQEAEEDLDKALLNKNPKGEQVSPSKAIPNAKCRDLKSPEKAAAIV